jgi:tRNA threonylcarbamoyladenosine biosynthesis protein TsaB
MNILAIETATEFCSVALQAGTDVLSRHEPAPREHANLLLPWVEQLLAEAELSLSRMDAIAYGRGPGSFTSLRLGIGVVQGLAFGTDIGVTGVSSLAALAQSSAAAIPGNTLLVATDARMQEIFTGCYTVAANGLVEPISEEAVCAPAALTLPAAACIGLGNGFSAYQEQLLNRLADQLTEFDADCWPDARSVIRLAMASVERGELDAAEQALPRYIRNQVAQKPN